MLEPQIPLGLFLFHHPHCLCLPQYRPCRIQLSKLNHFQHNLKINHKTQVFLKPHLTKPKSKQLPAHRGPPASSWGAWAGTPEAKSRPIARCWCQPRTSQGCRRCWARPGTRSAVSEKFAAESFLCKIVGLSLSRCKKKRFLGFCWKREGGV